MSIITEPVKSIDVQIERYRICVPGREDRVMLENPIRFRDGDSVTSRLRVAGINWNEHRLWEGGPLKSIVPDCDAAAFWRAMAEAGRY